MTVLATSDRLAVGDSTSRRMLAGFDIFFIQRGGGWYGGVPAVQRANHKLEPVWGEYHFSSVPGPTLMATQAEGRGCVLTKDGQFLYTVGAGAVYNFQKLNAETGAVVWEREDADPHFIHVALDADENIIIFGVDAATGTAGLLKKYTSGGALSWSLSIGGVTGIACDSNNNIYCTVTSDILRSPVTAEGLYKIGPGGGAPVWYASVPYGLNHVTVNLDDDIFVIGWEETIDTVDCQLFKYRPDSNARLEAVPVGPSNSPSDAYSQRLVCDSFGNVIAINYNFSGHTLIKFDSDLAIIWTVDYTGNAGGRMLAVDVQNRVHVIGTSPGESTYYNYNIHAASDGDFEFHSQRLLGGQIFYGIVCSRKIYAAEWTDQITNLVHSDMCCFLDDALPDYDYGSDTFASSPFWSGVDAATATYVMRHQPEGDTGIFDCIFQDPFIFSGVGDPGNNEQFDLLSTTPPCQNNKWDTYPGFGGIDTTPQLYTVTLIGMLKMSDDSPSPWNGVFLFVKGPGIYGMFFHHNHAEQLYAKFIIDDQHYNALGYFYDSTLTSGDRKERLIVTVGEDEGNVFSFSTATNHNEKLTNEPNENVKVPVPTPDAIAYGGTVSIYPGRIEQWDATTSWITNDIVAWEGVFYRADNDNVNSEPPSGDWTALV